jgi:hypothetical protein
VKKPDLVELTFKIEAIKEERNLMRRGALVVAAIKSHKANAALEVLRKASSKYDITPTLAKKILIGVKPG